MAVNWTAQQRKVIDLRDRSLLVSAAAGSGKTAVLVERIIKRITEGKKPMDVDKLLVVTFTNAAAAEMRERVQAAIEERLDADPQNNHLKRQQTLIRQAKITTIDSFCLSVLREQFQQIDLDPAFRIGDEGELRLLREDVLEKLIEKWHEQADPEFMSFWEAYNPGREDSKASGLILNLYEFAMASPRPATWLKNCRKEYEVESLKELEALPWMKGVCERAKRTLTELTALAKSAQKSFEEEEGMEAYADILELEAQMLNKASKAESYHEIRSELKSITFGKKPRKKKTDTYDEDRAAKLWGIHTDIKDEVGHLIESTFWQDSKELLHYHKLAGEQARVLANLTLEFLDAYAQAKRKRNVLDFHDLEHFALEIFSTETEEGEIPTDIAKEYSERFEEIMIDEYQDSNYVQELILSSISREAQGQPNIFMVGDVKQSIYRFRLARPELFMEKYEKFTTEDSPYQKIELHQNFRSREDVLNTINYFFYQIMHKSLGNVEYTEEAALHPGMDYEKTDENAGGPIRLMLLDTENANEPEEEMMQEQNTEDESSEDSLSGIRYNTREWEAVMIADEILRLTDTKTGKRIWDKKLNAYRPAEFKDVTILLRSIKGWADDFIPVLASKGIPAVAESGTGYFSALEVQNVINLLRIIDNPRQDIPLAGVLRSPIGGFSDEDLALMKLGAEENEDGLYGVLLSFLEKHEDAELSYRLECFFEKLDKYRTKSEYLPLHELLPYAMRDSGYYEYVCAMPASSRRKANLDMLVEKAAQFESTSYQGVFQFVRYLEKLKSYSVDYPEASEGAANNAVRIMSIHKSKGLEFPIVILAGIGKKFNEQDIRQSVILHPDYGIGVDAIDIENRTTAPTLIKNALAREIALDNLGEELRVLYVAMTRAKEQLILTGGKKALFDYFEKIVTDAGAGEELSWLSLSSSHSYMDWIVKAAAKHRSFDAVYQRLSLMPQISNPLYSEKINFEVELLTTAELTTREAAKRLDAAWYKKQLADVLKETSDEEEKLIRQKINARLDFDYRYDDMYQIAASLSVSEIKKRFEAYAGFEEGAYEQEEDILVDINELFDGEGDPETSKSEAEQEIVHTLPTFMKDEEPISGAQRGTLYHWMFEHLNPFKQELWEEQLQTWVENKILTGEEAECIDLKDIQAFYRTGLGKRCIAARKERRFFAEFPFCLGLPVRELNPQARVKEDSYIKVHGIMDAWFEENGNLILIDYKTDHVFGCGWEETLLKRYKVQISYYRMALEKMTGKRVTEAYLYSTTQKKTVLVE